MKRLAIDKAELTKEGLAREDTLNPRTTHPTQARDSGVKVFCFFFSKKKCFPFLAFPPQPNPQISAA